MPLALGQRCALSLEMVVIPAVLCWKVLGEGVYLENMKDIKQITLEIAKEREMLKIGDR